MKIVFFLATLFFPAFMLAQQPRLMLPIGHLEGANSVQYSFDGKRIVTTSNDNTSKVWDVVTGKLLSEFNAKGYQLVFSQFSKDGKKILTVSNGLKIWVWETITGKELFTMVGSTAQFSTDAKKIVAGQRSGLVRFWDNDNFNSLNTISAANKIVWCVEFSPDQQKIITTENDGTAKIWDAVSGKQVANLTGHNKMINSATFSPDNKLAMTASSDNTVKIWDATSGKLLKDFDQFNEKILQAKFSHDGKTCFIIARTNLNVYGLVMLFDTRSWTKQQEYKMWNVNYADFSPDDTKLAIAALDTIRIIEIPGGKTIQRFIGHTSAVNQGTFSLHDESIIFHSGLLGGHRKSTHQVDLKTGSLFEDFSGVYGINAKYPKLTVSPDGNKIAKFSKDKVQVVEAGTGKLLADLQGRMPYPTYLTEFSPDGKKIGSYYDKDNGILKIWNTETGTLISELKDTLRIRSDLHFSSDSKKAVIGGPKGKVFSVWDVENKSLLFTVDGVNEPKFTFKCLQFIDNDKKIIGIEGFNINIWDAKTGTLLDEIRDSCYLYDVDVSTDKKRIITAGGDGTAKIYNYETKELIRILNGKRYESQDLNVVKFSKDGKFIFTGAFDGSVKIWDAKTYKLIYTFYVFDYSEYLARVPGGYYQCSRDAAKLLYYVTDDLKVITFEQLDVKYNRPDKVLEAIGNSDMNLIKSYRKAYEKRIGKLGIDTLTFREGYSVPVADFVNRNEIEYPQSKKDLNLRIKASDADYKLDRYNVWVNEVPVYGQRGISIRKKNKNDLDVTVTVHLSEGINRIEASVTNVNATESYRIPLTVNYAPATRRKPVVHFIGIGIDKFVNPEYNLQYSCKDIRDLSLKLKQKFGADIVIDTLYNEDVTIQKVKALKQKLFLTNEEDKIIVSYSGHGLLSKDFDYYLSTYNINFEKPEVNGLSYEVLEGLLDSIPARKKLLLIDACHSGEVDKEELQRINTNADSLHLTRGIKPVVYKRDTTHLGMKNSFELMQSIFVNVGKGTGAVIISASAGTQFALEKGGNGIFTNCILEAMDKYPTIKVSELKRNVGEKVERLTSGLQKPTSRNELIAVDWDVW